MECVQRWTLICNKSEDASFGRDHGFVSRRIVAASPSNGVSCEWFESETRQNIPLLDTTMENQAEVGFYK